MYVRAPDLWFELIDNYGTKFAPLGDIAQVRRGITSGKDTFFFPIDCSTECLNSVRNPEEFKQQYGVSREEVESNAIKLVRCGDGRGEIRPIESRYLEPEVHSLMEIDGFVVSPENCSRLAFFIGLHKDQLKGIHAGRYIKWGEKQNLHLGPTCSARVTEEQEWYDLTSYGRGAIFWPMSQQYKHAIPLNTNNLLCNANLYNIHLPQSIDPVAMAGILNSSWVVLSKFQFGRPVGVEGNYKTQVIDANMMLVPDPRKAKTERIKRITDAFKSLSKRKALQFLSERRLREMAYRQSNKDKALENLSNLCELDMLDWRELDDAVLEMLGVESPDKRQHMIYDLYSYLREFFEYTRQKEEKAIINKNKAKRRGPARPGEIATQIFNNISENYPQFLRQYDSDFMDRSKPFDTFEIPAEGTAELFTDMFVEHGVRFMKGIKKRIALVETTSQVQDELMVLVANSGVRGIIRIPHEDDECREVLQEFERFINQRESQVRHLIKERTADEGIQEDIYEALAPMLLHAKRP